MYVSPYSALTIIHVSRAYYFHKVNGLESKLFVAQMKADRYSDMCNGPGNYKLEW